MAEGTTKGCLTMAFVVWAVVAVVVLLTEKLKTIAGNVMFGLWVIGAIVLIIISTLKK